MRFLALDASKLSHFTFSILNKHTTHLFSEIIRKTTFYVNTLKKQIDFHIETINKFKSIEFSWQEIVYMSPLEYHFALASHTFQ